MANLIGMQIGNYQLLRLLGKGGFADVYLAEHIHLNTMAAIKVLQTRLVGNAVEQFRDEARFVARLKHPHIIQILDFGVENDTPYLIMEYAAQGTLRQRHPNGTPVQPTAIVSYMRQVADALQYAHNQRVIHRDIKPENMLLGSNNEVLLSDFGLAMTNPSSRQSTKELIGTIAYMSPEQIQGKPQIASDQYALGIVVYEWVTGVRPFQGSFVELTVQHLSALPPPLRQHIPTPLPHVEEVVFKALAKDPQQRFGSVQAFAQALEQAYTPTILLLDVREDASTIKATLPGQEPEKQPQVLPSSSATTAWLSDTISRIVYEHNEASPKWPRTPLFAVIRRFCCQKVASS